MKLETRMLFPILAAIGLVCSKGGYATPAAEQKPAANAEIEALVEQLKSESFNERQKAVARLVEIGRPALAAVNKAATAGDPEVALLAKKIREALGIDGAPIDILHQNDLAIVGAYPQ